MVHAVQAVQAVTVLPRPVAGLLPHACWRRECLRREERERREDRRSETRLAIEAAKKKREYDRKWAKFFTDRWNAAVADALSAKMHRLAVALAWMRLLGDALSPLQLAVDACVDVLGRVARPAGGLEEAVCRRVAARLPLAEMTTRFAHSVLRLATVMRHRHADFEALRATPLRKTKVNGKLRRPSGLAEAKPEEVKWSARETSVLDAMDYCELQKYRTLSLLLACKCSMPLWRAVEEIAGHVNYENMRGLLTASPHRSKEVRQRSAELLLTAIREFNGEMQLLCYREITQSVTAVAPDKDDAADVTITYKRVDLDPLESGGLGRGRKTNDLMAALTGQVIAC
jgi:hypothetical protein